MIYWRGNKLYHRGKNGRVRHLANYRRPMSGYSAHLETFWGNLAGGYYVGHGMSLTLEVESETYWTVAEGRTYLIHYNHETGLTGAKADDVRGEMETCTRGGRA